MGARLSWFLSAEEYETALMDAINAGATAYLTKPATADQIVEAVPRAAAGEVLIPCRALRQSDCGTAANGH
jgi:DNA-binding NarL/FixJ family response regulator